MSFLAPFCVSSVPLMRWRCMQAGDAVIIVYWCDFHQVSKGRRSTGSPHRGRGMSLSAPEVVRPAVVLMENKIKCVIPQALTSWILHGGGWPAEFLKGSLEDGEKRNANANVLFVAHGAAEAEEQQQTFSLPLRKRSLLPVPSVSLASLSYNTFMESAVAVAETLRTEWGRLVEWRFFFLFSVLKRAHRRRKVRCEMSLSALQRHNCTIFISPQ